MNCVTCLARAVICWLAFLMTSAVSYSVVATDAPKAATLIMLAARPISAISKIGCAKEIDMILAYLSKPVILSTSTWLRL